MWIWGVWGGVCGLMKVCGTTLQVCRAVWQRPGCTSPVWGCGGCTCACPCGSAEVTLFACCCCLLRLLWSSHVCSSPANYSDSPHLHPLRPHGPPPNPNLNPTPCRPGPPAQVPRGDPGHGHKDPAGQEFGSLPKVHQTSSVRAAACPLAAALRWSGCCLSAVAVACCRTITARDRRPVPRGVVQLP